MAQAVIDTRVAKLLGFLLLIAGAVLLHVGWDAHTATSPQLLETMNDPRPGRSIWLLGLGAVAVVWGLFVLLPRRT
jgi:Protein of unknown function (DUF3185).